MSPPEPAQALIRRLTDNLAAVIRYKDDVLTQLIAAFATGRHVLLEDVPGSGKTTLAKALARSIHGEFQRIQFTPDQLPSDILLADEINRASSRTQSALLEAMAEGQVSLDNERHPLSDGFFVIADPEPDRVSGHLSPARGADGSVRDAAGARLCRARGRGCVGSAEIGQFERH